MKFARIAAIAAVLAIGPVAGGCTVEGALADAARFMMQIKSSLAEASETIRVGCNTIGIVEQEAAVVSPVCGQKVSRVRAGIEAICRDRALLTDDVIGNYVKAIGAAVKNAKDAQRACAPS